MHDEEEKKKKEKEKKKGGGGEIPAQEVPLPENPGLQPQEKAPGPV